MVTLRFLLSSVAKGKDPNIRSAFNYRTILPSASVYYQHKVSVLRLAAYRFKLRDDPVLPPKVVLLYLFIPAK